MSAKQRWEIRAAVARRVGRYRRITAESGTATTVVSLDLFEPNNFWIEFWLYCLQDFEKLGAWPEGFMRRVSAYAQSTQQLTVDLAYPGVAADWPDNGDIFELYPSYLPVPELNDLLDEAIEAASAYWFKPAWDESTVSFALNTHTYSLPSDVKNLRAVYVRSGSSYGWNRYNGWKVEGQPGAYVLKTTGEISGDAALSYEASLDWSTDPATDASYLNVVSSPATNEHAYEQWARAFMVEYCIEKIHEKLMNEGDKQKANRHWNLMRFAKTKMDEIAQWHAQPRLSATVTKPLWAEHGDDLRGRAYSTALRK